MKACRTKEGGTMHLLCDGERGGDERRNVLKVVFFVPHDDGLNCLGVTGVNARGAIAKDDLNCLQRAPAHERVSVREVGR